MSSSGTPCCSAYWRRATIPGGLGQPPGRSHGASVEIAHTTCYGRAPEPPRVARSGFAPRPARWAVRSPPGQRHCQGSRRAITWRPCSPGPRAGASAPEASLPPRSRPSSTAARGPPGGRSARGSGPGPGTRSRWPWRRAGAWPTLEPLPRSRVPGRRTARGRCRRRPLVVAKLGGRPRTGGAAGCPVPAVLLALRPLYYSRSDRISTVTRRWKSLRRSPSSARTFSVSSCSRAVTA
jgi:hypothetical protein